METQSIVRGVRLSVDKGRLVADLIRGKKVDQARDILKFTQKKAAGIVKKALEAPIRKLAANAGQDGSVIIDTVRRTAAEKKNKNIGYNVLTNKYVDMIQAGVIDPVKVVRGALENAASIAAMILTTDVLITDMPEKDKAPAMPPGGMGGMDY